MNWSAADRCSADASTLRARYENLRLAGFGEPLPPEARSGLVLFLRRGMWGWARTLPDTCASRGSTPGPSSGPTVPSESEALIHVLAGMAMSSPERRAP
jgi:hypothetical protein